MVDSVAIANRALASVGTRSTISAMTEGSNESINVSLIYSPTRQQMFAGAPWGFSKATATLSLLKAAPGTPENPTTSQSAWSSANSPPPGWAYSYAYPGDCLFARKVVQNLNPQAGLSTPIFPASGYFGASAWECPGSKFEIATDTDVNGNPVTVILSNTPQAILCYTRDIVPETLWTPMFQEAIVAALAGKLVLALTGEMAKAKLKMDQANAVMIEARRVDENEGPTMVDHMPDWITQGHGWRSMSPGWVGGWSAPWGPLFGLGL